MKNKDTDEVLFVVVFTLLKKEDVEKEAEAAKQGDEAKGEEGAKGEDEKVFEPKPDDLD